MSDKISEILKKLQAQHDVPKMSADEYINQQCVNSNNLVGNLNEIDGYNCDKCLNKGLIYFLRPDARNGQELAVKDCKCMSIRKTLRRAQKSGLGNILTDYTFDKYIAESEWQKVVKGKAQSFCSDDNAQWFYIGGQTGAGKSHICTAICGHYIKAGKDCKYMLWRDDAVKLKSCVNDFSAYQSLIKEFKDVDVLYIDDFLKVQSGAEPTTADINLAFELLNHRLLDNDKITIISSEFTINKALEFDEATIGRIYQQAGDYKINIDKDIKKNYRLK